MKKTDKIIFSVFFLLAMQPFYGILALFIKKWGIMKIFSFLCCFITLKHTYICYFFTKYKNTNYLHNLYFFIGQFHYFIDNYIN